MKVRETKFNKQEIRKMYRGFKQESKTDLKENIPSLNRSRGFKQVSKTDMKEINIPSSRI